MGCCAILLIRFFALSFCLFPRTVCEKDNHIQFNHLGFDYFGVIVGFFTLLVTFLIGWNIYSTIKAKEELETCKELYPQIKNTISKEMEKQIREYDKQVQGGICLVIGLSWSMKGEYKYAWEKFIQGLEYQNDYPNPLYADELIEMLDNIAVHKDYKWLDEEMREKTIRVLGNSKSDKRIKAIERYAKITL